MKAKLLVLTFGVVALLFSSCNRECTVCTMYDLNNNALGEYTSCADDPEQDAIENFCEGCEGQPFTAKCNQEE
ncbi:MAG: hypothetical protein JXQ87_15725 [Bacteroidia bacterium]